MKYCFCNLALGEAVPCRPAQRPKRKA